MKNKSKSVLDFLGISSALVCLIHCLAFPVLTLLPISTSHNHWIDLSFAFVGLLVVFRVGRQGAGRYIMLVLWLSILLILSSVVIAVLINYHSKLLYLGGIGLITGHIMNYRNHINTHDEK